VLALARKHWKSLHHFGDARFGSRFIHIAAHLEILAHRHGRKDIMLLRHVGEAEPRDLTWGEAGQRMTAQRNRTLRGLQQSGDRLEQCRLPGSVRANDADDLAILDREIHPFEDFVGRRISGNNVGRFQEAHFLRPI
jgi:hypothetical protein